MSRALGALVLAAVIAVGAALPAAADEVDPNFLSKLTAVEPPVGGLDVRIVDRGDELQLANKTGKTVLVEGYTGEPYLRFLADGTVEQNQNSPATYLNQDRFATRKVPANASSKARPAWKVVARNGSYEWHDHRIHYMGKGTPSQVKDESVRQKVYDWTIDLREGGRPVRVTGALFWTPRSADADGGGIEAWQIGLAVLVLLLACAAGVFVLGRRRGGGGAATAGPQGTEGTEAKPAKERKPAEEAW